jgi:hypothetical protein
MLVDQKAWVEKVLIEPCSMAQQLKWMMHIVQRPSPDEKEDVDNATE